jgi:two-component system OmpR family sensor kinase
MARIIVGFDLQCLNNELSLLRWKIAGVCFLIFLAGTTVGFFMVYRFLNPLQTNVKNTAAIASGKLKERIPDLTGTRTTELVHLTENLNGTFVQLESLFQKQMRFTADASHELRTPLTALMAQISLGLNRRRTPDEYEQMLKVCEKSSLRLKMIIEDLLDLSRYDSGTYKLEIETLHLDALVQSFAEELEPYVAEKGGVLETDLKGKTIRCDPFRFEQVMANLINNALQHNSEPVEITLKTRNTNDCSIIEVIDNGAGIQPDNIDKLFDRFYQQDAARGNKGPALNSGLGLSISKAIVEAHGGSLSVTSIPGRGTIFRVSLPL